MNSQVLFEMYAIESKEYVPQELYNFHLSKLAATKLLEAEGNTTNEAGILKLLQDSYKAVINFIWQVNEGTKKQLYFVLNKSVRDELSTANVTTNSFLNWLMKQTTKISEKYPKLASIVKAYQKFTVNFVMKNKLTIGIAYLLALIGLAIILRPVTKFVTGLVGAVFKFILHPVQTYQKFMAWLKGNTGVEENTQVA